MTVIQALVTIHFVSRIVIFSLLCRLLAIAEWSVAQLAIPPERASRASLGVVALGQTAPEPLSEVAVRYLRDAILEGRLRAGVRIRQEAVARELGTSRIPVREALRQLENEGLVHLAPRTGARVARLDFAESAEVYRIREELEPLALAQSAPLLSTEQVAHLRDLILQIEGSEDPGVWLILDRRLHLASYAAAPMPRLLKMIENFWNTTQQYRRVYYGIVASERRETSTNTLPMTHLDHRLLFDALQRRDGDDAADIMRLHIRRTRQALANHREMFEL